MSNSMALHDTSASADALPQVGRPLPALTLPSMAGEVVRTKAFKQRQPFLLLVVPTLDDAATEQWLAALAGLRAEVAEANATALVVARDTLDALRAWQTGHSFPYPLLADAEGVARQGFVGADEGVALYAVDRYNYVLARWAGRDASALPSPADALVPIRDAEYEDCGCGLPIWQEG